MVCPWDSSGSSPVQFCENALCAWIREPANTWSNIGFLIIGLFLIKKARTENQIPLQWIGIVSFITGLGSGFFHMSGNYWGGVLDYLGMFLLTGLMTGYNLKRWLSISNAIMYFTFFGTTFIFISLLLTFPDKARFLYGWGMPCCLIELRLFFRDRRKIRYGRYLLSSGLFTIAVYIWWLDQSKIICNPDNHFINGHALWHLLTAFSLIPLYHYYQQFWPTDKSA